MKNIIPYFGKNNFLNKKFLKNLFIKNNFFKNFLKFNFNYSFKLKNILIFFFKKKYNKFEIRIFISLVFNFYNFKINTILFKNNKKVYLKIFNDNI